MGAETRDSPLASIWSPHLAWKWGMTKRRGRRLFVLKGEDGLVCLPAPPPHAFSIRVSTAPYQKHMCGVNHLGWGSTGGV